MITDEIFSRVDKGKLIQATLIQKVRNKLRNPIKQITE